MTPDQVLAAIAAATTLDERRAILARHRTDELAAAASMRWERLRSRDEIALALLLSWQVGSKPGTVAPSTIDFAYQGADAFLARVRTAAAI